MRTCQCMNHFVHYLRSWRSCATELHAFAARSHLITADKTDHRPHTVGRVGYPFPEVNLPEEGGGAREREFNASVENWARSQLFKF